MIAPHPDDETLGAGGLIQRVLSAHGTVRVVLVTAGDGYVEAVRYETGELRPRAPVYVAYGERRLREARAAVRKLGGDRMRWASSASPMAASSSSFRLTGGATCPSARRSPPYREALDRTVAYDGAPPRARARAARDPADHRRVPIRSTAIPITAPRASSCCSRWGTGSPGTDVSRVSSRTSCTGPVDRRDGTIPSRRWRRGGNPWSSPRTSPTVASPAWPFRSRAPRSTGRRPPSSATSRSRRCCRASSPPSCAARSPSRSSPSPRCEAWGARSSGRRGSRQWLSGTARLVRRPGCSAQGRRRSGSQRVRVGGAEGRGGGADDLRPGEAPGRMARRLRLRVPGAGGRLPGAGARVWAPVRGDPDHASATRSSDDFDSRPH